MNSGYQCAVGLAVEKLSILDPEAICKKTGVKIDNGVYYVKWFGEYRPVESGPVSEQILMLHYLLCEGGRSPCGVLTAFREIRGGGFYAPKFDERVVRPIVKRFGSAPDRLVSAGLPLRGEPIQTGDAGIVLKPLPELPITFIVWAGDDELLPEGTVLFDKTAPEWLVPEDLVVLASVCTYSLINADKNAANI